MTLDQNLRAGEKAFIGISCSCKNASPHINDSCTAKRVSSLCLSQFKERSEWTNRVYDFLLVAFAYSSLTFGQLTTEKNASMYSGRRF
jgi:hypothetical protein